MRSALLIEDLWKSYAAGVLRCSARVWVLRGCALHVLAGEHVAIVGGRGAGKTTLIRCVQGLLRADRGRIATHAPLQVIDDDMAPDCADALLVTARNEELVRGRVDRVLHLRDGRLHATPPIRQRRVAEAAADTLR